MLDLRNGIRRLSPVFAALALALVFAPAVLAQTPPGQDNPEYQQTTPTTTTPTTTTPSDDTGDTAPDEETGTGDDTDQAPDEAQTAPSSSGQLGRTLPLTGLPVGIVAGLGVALISLGGVLRRRTSD